MFGYPPNITGSVEYEKNGYGNYAEYSGALSATTTSGYAEGGGQAGKDKNAKINLDASLSNGTYSGAVLQVPALQTLICIKI